LAEQLPVYSGLVEAARANNRQGFPVGAAYLRGASGVLTGTILPSAERVYATEANRLSDNYATGTGSGALVVLIVAIVVALGLLAVAQIYVARISHRTLNVGMLFATVVLTALSIWAVIGFVGEQNALARARKDSDSVELLSASKVLLSRAQTDQSLTLVSRGSDRAHPLDFNRTLVVLSPARGLLGRAEALARGSSESATFAEYDAYRRESR
jgi:hypothetical protein